MSRAYRRTKRELRAAIKELESTNEALKVTIEASMSMNEELQSANEELETSKQELQSVNEELTNVNNQPPGGRAASSSAPAAAAASAVPAPMAAPMPAEGHGGRVLIVDDDADSSESTAVLLRLFGYEVESAIDLESALEAARRLRPQVALLDLALPRSDGYDVLRRLRALPEMPRDAKYVAVSGFGRPEDMQRTKEAGFERLLVKPVDPDELDRVLNTLLRS